MKPVGKKVAQNDLWSEISLMESSIQKENASKLSEVLYDSFKVKKKKVKKIAKKADKDGKKKEKIQKIAFIDGKRSYNVTIGINRLKDTSNIANGIKNMDSKMLKEETLCTLIRYLPTKAEI